MVVVKSGPPVPLLLPVQSVPLLKPVMSARIAGAATPRAITTTARTVVRNVQERVECSILSLPQKDVNAELTYCASRRTATPTSPPPRLQRGLCERGGGIAT